MKIKLPLFLILTLGALGCRTDDKFNLDCIPANLQNGVIAFYPFIGGSLQDESANSNNLTNTTSAVPSSDRNGNANCAFQFDNSQNNDEFLTSSKSKFLNGLDEFSVSIWYEPFDTTRYGGAYEVLIGRGDASWCPDRRGEWSIGLYDCRRAVFGHNNSVWANRVTGFPFDCNKEIVALTGKWHHVVKTKKGDEFKIYFNGHLDESVVGNANCGNLHLAEDIGDVFIGKKFTGKIDDVLIYNRELSQSEVTQLFNLEPCCQ